MSLSDSGRGALAPPVCGSSRVENDMVNQTNKWGSELAHALALREASKAAHNRGAYQYWRNRVQYCRARLNSALRDAGFEVPVPEQRPLIIDDLIERQTLPRK